MRAVTLALAASAVLAVLGSTQQASANFIETDTPPSGEQLYNGDAYKDVASFTGSVGDHNSGPQVSVTTIGNVDSGSGFATIKPVKDGSLTDLTFTPADDTLFSGFSFRGQLAAAGTVTVTVIDSNGVSSGPFTFTEDKDGDFAAIGAISKDGETLGSFEISSAGFKEVKQIEFISGDPVNVAEPASIALLGIGLLGLGLIRRRVA